MEENTMQKWEHLIVEENPTADTLNNGSPQKIATADKRKYFTWLGSEGWEMVAAFVRNNGKVEYHFKRPIENN
jgi:hypothetical protein